jgi:hypothetical protein
MASTRKIAVAGLGLGLIAWWWISSGASSPGVAHRDDEAHRPEAEAPIQQQPSQPLDPNEQAEAETNAALDSSSGLNSPPAGNGDLRPLTRALTPQDFRDSRIELSRDARLAIQTCLGGSYHQTGTDSLDQIHQALESRDSSNSQRTIGLRNLHFVQGDGREIRAHFVPGERQVRFFGVAKDGLPEIISPPAVLQGLTQDQVWDEIRSGKLGQVIYQERQVMVQTSTGLESARSHSIKEINDRVIDMSVQGHEGELLCATRASEEPGTLVTLCQCLEAGT